MFLERRRCKIDSEFRRREVNLPTSHIMYLKHILKYIQYDNVTNVFQMYLEDFLQIFDDIFNTYFTHLSGIFLWDA